jgi:hypothetical protein
MIRLRRLRIFFVILAVSFALPVSPANARPSVPDLSWPVNQDVVPDEHTAVMVCLAYYQGMLRRDIGDPREVAKLFRAKSVMDKRFGTVWVVDAKDDAMPKNAIGGFFIATISKHDGRILEFFLEQ